MKVNVGRWCIRITGCALLSLATGALALTEDKQEAVHLQAGSADLNQQTHRGIYLKDVRLDQGTTHVTAAEAITEGNAKNELTLAIARGNAQVQAHYCTQPALDKPLLHAYADVIYYYPARRRIELIGNARVEQGENSIAAPKISYDTEQQHVVTESNTTARTLIIIHPEKKT